MNLRKTSSFLLISQITYDFPSLKFHYFFKVPPHKIYCFHYSGDCPIYKFPFHSVYFWVTDFLLLVALSSIPHFDLGSLFSSSLVSDIHSNSSQILMFFGFVLALCQLIDIFATSRWEIIVRNHRKHS